LADYKKPKKVFSEFVAFGKVSPTKMFWRKNLDRFLWIASTDLELAAKKWRFRLGFC